MLASLRFFLGILASSSLGLALLSHSSRATHTQACTTLTLPQLERSFKILSVLGVEVHNYSVPAEPALFSPAVNDINFCNVTVTITHLGDGDYEIVRVWLPLTTWNGRFQTVGGGGLAAGTLDLSLPAPVGEGYAAASSEGGLTLNGTIDANTGVWVLKKDNSLNMGLLENFSHRSTHDATVVGKALTNAFYGTAPTFSYYTGCSTGGRQGYFAARYNPDDFDGILATSPAVNFVPVAKNLFWAPVVMANIVVPPQCVFDAYVAAITTVCDPLDGAIDGIVSNPENCIFDTHSLVGTAVNCTTENVTITADHAKVVFSIMQGPGTTAGQSIWWGIQPGAPFWGVANTTIVNGTQVPVPFSAAQAVIAYFDFQNLTYDTANMTYADFDEATTLSLTKYTPLFGNADPDLSAFQARGGKLLTWHGMSDEYIPHRGSVLYRERLENDMGGAKNVEKFHRLFLAPAVQHCGGGYGPLPIDPLGALVNWVEKGVAPDILPATNLNAMGKNITRNLCPWPQVAKYDGTGIVTVMSSFTCVSNYY